MIHILYNEVMAEMGMTDEVAPEDRVFLTVDFGSQFDDIRHLVTDLGDKVHALKLGVGFYLHPRGHDIHRFLRGQGITTMYDAKFDEDPDQMAPVVDRAMELGHRYVSVAPFAGREALMAAARRQGDSQIVAAISSSKWQANGNELSLIRAANKRLPDSKQIRNVMCNVHYASAVKRRLGRETCVIATGIRMEGDPQNDQPHVATPAEAISVYDADRLAIGRSITSQPGVDQMVRAYERVLENIRTDL